MGREVRWQREYVHAGIEEARKELKKGWHEAEPSPAAVSGQAPRRHCASPAEG
jgi:hypothetical protein